VRTRFGARGPDAKLGVVQASVWQLLGAGFLFGLATVLRCQNGALLAALVLIVLARCRFAPPSLWQRAVSRL